MIDKGAGLIKVGATGIGPDGEHLANLGPEALEVAVRAAHEAGLKIAAHCHGFVGSRQAVEAGIDSIDHGTYVDEETCQLMAEKGTYLVPTRSAMDARERLARQFGIPQEQRGDNLDRMENGKESLQRAIRVGVKIAAGTDAGGSPARHGFLAREIELLVEAGMSPKAALESATKVASELMGIDDQAGTIEVGKQADLVLIDGDPYSDPGALRNVWAVFQGGRRVR